MTKIISYKPVGTINAANATNFQKELMMVIDSASSTILVDMKKVEFLDSAGLMALTSSYKYAHNHGKKLSICSVSPSVRIIFELSQLDEVFNIFENRHHFEQSLNSLIAA